MIDLNAFKLLSNIGKLTFNERKIQIQNTNVSFVLDVC